MLFANSHYFINVLMKHSNFLHFSLDVRLYMAVLLYYKLQLGLSISDII